MKKTAASKPAAKTASVKAAPVKAPAATAKKTSVSKASGKVPPVQPVKPQPKAKPDADAKEKGKKVKLVRDSFTMPETEYAVLGEVKKACLKAGFEVKKSELLRVGVALIRQMEIGKLRSVLQTLTPLKAGRPKKEK